jgi:hypothetical protein
MNDWINTIMLSAVERLDRLAGGVHADRLQADGWNDTITNKATETIATLKSVSIVVAIALVIIVGVKTRGNVAAIVSIGLVCGLMLWLIWGGIFVIRDKTSEELSSSPARTLEVPEPPALVM